MSESLAVEPVQDVTEAAKNITGSDGITNEKVIASTPGIAIAYASLVLMAMLPIVFGAIRSVRLHKLKKVSGIKWLPLSIIYD